MILRNSDNSIEYIILKQKNGINCTFRYHGISTNFIETTETLPAYLDFNADQLGVFIGINSMDVPNKINRYYNAFPYLRLYSLSMVEKILAQGDYQYKRLRLENVFSLMGIRELSTVLAYHEIEDNEQIPLNTLSDFKKALVEMLISSLSMYPMKQDALTLMFDHAIDYGVASGIDVFFRANPSSNDLIIFRLKETDYISPKNFKIWAMAASGWKVSINDDEWADFVKFVVSKATKALDDPISPPLIITLCDRIKLGNIYANATEEYVEAVTSGGSMAVALLQEDTLVVSAALITDVISILRGVKQRQARQMMMPFLIDGIEKSTVKTFTLKDKATGKTSNKTVRVWKFDWNRLLTVAPELEDKKIISDGDADEQNE